MGETLSLKHRIKQTHPHRHSLFLRGSVRSHVDFKFLKYICYKGKKSRYLAMSPNMSYNMQFYG